MNILIYSFSRCGSSNLLDFLEQEFLNQNNESPYVKTWFEPFGEIQRTHQFKKWYHQNLKNKHIDNQPYIPNLIVKTIVGDLAIIKHTHDNKRDNNLIHRELRWYDQKFNFQKIIILHRENMEERIESMYAQMKLIEIQQDKYNDGPYVFNSSIDKETLETRINQELTLTEQIKTYKSDDNFLVISYEDLYYRNGLDKLKKFLNRPEWYNIHMMDTKNKKRKSTGDDTTTIIND